MIPQVLYARVWHFIVAAKPYDAIRNIYADSAEQTLIEGLRDFLKDTNMTVKNSLKHPINDRIFATTLLMGGKRVFMASECEMLVEVFQGAVLDDKVHGEERIYFILVPLLSSIAINLIFTLSLNSFFFEPLSDWVLSRTIMWSSLFFKIKSAAFRDGTFTLMSL